MISENDALSSLVTLAKNLSKGRSISFFSENVKTMHFYPILIVNIHSRQVQNDKQSTLQHLSVKNNKSM